MVDFDIVNIIVLGFAGFSVLGLTEIIKRWIKGFWPSVGSWVGYLVSLIVSAGFTLYYFLQSQGFPGWSIYILYVISVWLTANGVFKAVRR